MRAGDEPISAPFLAAAIFAAFLALACFRVFDCAMIETFTLAEDLVLHNHMGGGTTVVEALANG